VEGTTVRVVDVREGGPAALDDEISVVFDDDPALDQPRSLRSAWDQDNVTASIAAALSSLALTWVVYERLTPLSGGLGFLVVWWIVFVATSFFIAWTRSDVLTARDHLARSLVVTAAALVLIPLAAIMIGVVAKGVHALGMHFVTQDQSHIGPLDSATKGGASHAIIGTLEQVGIAALVSVPLGFATAVFLNEIGGPMSKPVRLLVDAMSAIPSIVAGLFIYTALIQSGYLHQSGIAAALSLSVLMLPVVTRTAEVVLRVVPGGLREASLALGAPEWRTTSRVILPTARAGMLTAIILGVARTVGETAPLLLTTLGNVRNNFDPFADRQAALPLYVFQLFRQDLPNSVQRAWNGALILIVLVLTLFIIARIIGGRGPGHIGRLRRRRLARKGLA
jgi:phosphate transport system permease protein